MSASLTTVVRLCAPYFAKHKRKFGVSVVLTVIQVVSLIPIPFLIESLFKTLSTRGETHTLFVILLYVCCLVVLSAGAAIVNRHVTLSFIKEAVGDLRIDLVRRMLARSYIEHAELDLDRVHTDLVQGTERIDCMVSAVLTQVVPGVLVGVGIGVVLVYLDPLLACVVFLSLPVLYVSARIVGSRVQNMVKKFHNDFSRFSEGVSFVLHFYELISFSGAQDHELGRQKKSVLDLRFSSKQMALLSTIHTIMQGNAMVLVGVLVLLVGGIKIISGALTLGVVLSFYIALNVLVSHMRVAVGALPVVIEGFESSRALSGHLESLDNSDQGVENIEHIQRIEMEGVSFGYGSEVVLHDIHLTLTKGEMIALYGPSGSGKSTLVSLLLGLYQPEVGVVRVNGVDLSLLDMNAYRARVGVLTQNLYLFSGTIRENISYGMSDISDDHMREMCMVSGVQDFIDTLPEGYDTPIGEQGVHLSGGQRQRIAIARALVRTPNVLLLDEPDNNLDEQMIGEILARIRSRNITTLVITHNRSLIQHFDRVYECERGSEGTRVRELEKST